MNDSDGKGSGFLTTWGGRVALSVLGLLLVGVLLAPSAREAATTFPWAIHHLQPLWLLAAALCQGGVYVSLAGILGAPLTPLGFRANGGGWRLLVPLAAVFLLANRALPGPAIAGLAVLTFRLGRRGIPPDAAQVVAATFYLADYAGFLLLGVAAVVVAAVSRTASLDALHPALLGVALLVIVLAGVGIWHLYRHADLLDSLVGRGATGVARLLRTPSPEVWRQEAQDALRNARTRWETIAARPGTLVTACLWAIVMHCCEAATLWFSARAFGLPPSPAIAGLGYVAGNLGAILSFLPGGLGLYEGGMVAALHRVGGMELRAALAATLLYRLLSLWLPLPLLLSSLRQSLQDRTGETTR